MATLTKKVRSLLCVVPPLTDWRHEQDRKDWAAILNGRIVHFSYLSATEEEAVRPDTRVINLCNGTCARGSGLAWS